MKIKETEIPGVLIIEPEVFGDSRGFFFESYNLREFKKAGIHADFVQDNHSKSVKGVVRGLHFQKKHPQGKLIRVLTGEVWDVVVDIRRKSPTYKKWIGVLLSEENKKQIWIPPGLAHGFSVLSESSEFAYKVTDFYHPEDEAGIIWNDPELTIDWQVKEPSLSDKDQNLPKWSEAEEDFPTI